MSWWVWGCDHKWKQRGLLVLTQICVYWFFFLVFCCCCLLFVVDDGPLLCLCSSQTSFEGPVGLNCILAPETRMEEQNERAWKIHAFLGLPQYSTSKNPNPKRSPLKEPKILNVFFLHVIDGLWIIAEDGPCPADWPRGRKQGWGQRNPVVWNFRARP